MPRATGIPPLALTALLAFAMWLAARFVPGLELLPRARLPIAALVAVVALAIGALALQPFLRARTTVDPRRPERATRLVTGGVYAYSRNPMYVAMLLVLVAWGLWLGNLAALLVAPAFFVAYLNRRQIPPEERALAAAFGADYERYRRDVRRWL